MAVERTLSIIKPDAVAKNVIGEIYNRFEKAGLRIVAARMEHPSAEKAGEFYAVHRDRPFYQHLVDLMTYGTVLVQALKRVGDQHEESVFRAASHPAHVANSEAAANFFVCQNLPGKRQIVFVRTNDLKSKIFQSFLNSGFASGKFVVR